MPLIASMEDDQDKHGKGVKTYLQRFEQWYSVLKQYFAVLNRYLSVSPARKKKNKAHLKLAEAKRNCHQFM